MALAMLVTGPDGPEPVIGPEVAGSLAGMGISRISVLQDPSGIGVVLEGWAFDPIHVKDVVRAMFPDGDADIRVFHEVEHVAVTLASGERRTR